jgi:hypothetical protein
VLDILFFILKGQPLGFHKKCFVTIEPKLSVMWERIGEALKMCTALTNLQKHDISANMGGAYIIVFSASRYFPCLICIILPIGAKGF